MAITKKYFEKKYSETLSSPKDIKFVIYDNEIWHECLKLLKHASVVADFGSGGGTLLYNVSKVTNAKIIGIEQSEATILHSKTLVPGMLTLSEDILNTSLKNESIDFSFSTMAIEHVDEDQFVSEAYRVLKSGGYFLITSVMKKGHAWYFYKNDNGETVLEPTHLREYVSSRELENVLQYHGFSIVKSKASQIRFPLIDPLIKILARTTGSKFVKNLPTTRLIEKLRLLLRISVPGYFAIEILARKIKS